MDDYAMPVEMERTEWTKVTDDAGNLVYEGFALDKNPCGSGTAFFPNGNRYKEGWMNRECAACMKSSFWNTIEKSIVN